MTTKKAELETEKQEAIADLKDLFKQAGYVVYTTLRHVSRSGMMRKITAFVIVDGKPVVINYRIAQLGSYKREKGGDYLIVYGCGMDMGFDVVYNTSRQVYPDGFMCHGKNCQSSAHTNGDRNYKPHKHNDGGYALKQIWV